MKIRQYIIFLIVFEALITSCDFVRIYENNIPIPEAVWNQYNIVKFDVEITDTINTHNIYVYIRNTGMYTMSNIFLFITTTGPTGHSVRDTIECVLADNHGKWLGKGIGDIWGNQLPFKMYVRFTNIGMYSFEVEHGMRLKDLPNIVDVGLRVEKMK